MRRRVRLPHPDKSKKPQTSTRLATCTELGQQDRPNYFNVPIRPCQISQIYLGKYWEMLGKFVNL